MEDRWRSEASRILGEASRGDPARLSELIPLVYGELRRIAARCFRRERTAHTLEPTALVHEVFLRLSGCAELGGLDRARVLGIAAEVMRRVLVEHARARATLKRGGRLARLTLSDGGPAAEEPAARLDVLALDEALERLAHLDERQARVVDLHFFGGLSLDEIGDVLGVSLRTVKYDWALARAWLRRELLKGEETAS